MRLSGDEVGVMGGGGGREKRRVAGGKEREGSEKMHDSLKILGYLWIYSILSDAPQLHLLHQKHYLLSEPSRLFVKARSDAGVDMQHFTPVRRKTKMKKTIGEIKDMESAALSY